MMNKKVIAVALALALAGGSYAQDDTAKKKVKAYMVSDAHLDTQWNWDIQTTINEYVWNTISQNLFLLKKYPEYVFNFEGGVKYAWMKEYYPEQYEEMKKFIEEGRWHIAGSSWEASDVLVPSVEASIRNIMLGQTYYRQEFGKEGTDIFLPDCFGFGWTLPTIAAHCGLIGFSSQKLDWRNHPFYGKSKHPFTIGLWKGIDGKQVMLAHGYDYGRKWNNEDLSKNKDLEKLAQRTPLNTVYRYYGTGDIGDSPTLGSVRSVEQGIKGDGPVEVISATSDQLFKDYLPFNNHPELPVFDGELLMDVHGTGCYTSQAAMKQRVGLARALANNPEVLLMDEAFSALDPLIRVQMQDELLTLQSKMKKTIVFITLDLSEAIKLGDRIAIMKDGEIVQIGTSEEILTEPANAYVERFVENVDRSKIITASSVMVDKPIVARLKKEGPEVLIRKMRERNLTVLPVVDSNNLLVGEVRLNDLLKLRKEQIRSIESVVRHEVHSVLGDTVLEDILPLMTKTNSPIWVVNENREFEGVVPLSSLIIEVTGKDKEEINEIIQNAIEL